MTYADFAFVCDQLKLGFARDTIMTIFTYMDKDEDTCLKYRDFCNLCAENVSSSMGSGPLSFGESSMVGSKGSDFSKIIKSLKSKNPSNHRGRGGPNFK